MHFLVHPVLLNVIGRLNPAFLQRIDCHNIIGYDRPWESRSGSERSANARMLCVLKADVHGFGNLMHAGADGPVRKAVADAVQCWAPSDTISETGGGDSILIAEDDPVALAQIARHLMDDVFSTPGQPRLRIALHYGEVQTRERNVDLKLTIVGGAAILCAARVEPVAEPGQIWATEEFREQFLQRPSLWRTTPLKPTSGVEPFNVKKSGSLEPDLWVRLHRLES